MPPERKTWTDETVEQVIGNLLRGGVLLSALIVLTGGILYLYKYGSKPADYHEFHPVDPTFCSPIGIARAATTLSSRAIIQLGLLVLIATPVARVIFSVFAFARERDWAYVGITLVVLVILLYSLFNAHLGGA
jgi:uncharacterized membrane protein